MIVISKDTPEVLVQTEGGIFWSPNLAYAMEFDNRTSMWKQVPKKIIKQRAWETIEIPDDIEKQKKLARMYNLTFTAHYDVGPYGDLFMKRNHPDKYFYVKEITKEVGISNTQLKKYSEIVGPPINNPLYDEMVNPGGVGRKRFLYSAEQVNQIFRLRLKDPKLCARIVIEKYERWLVNLEG